MINKYKITGMTCQNCVEKIESRLNNEPYILGASVTLENEQLEIESEREVGVGKLNTILAPFQRYSVSQFQKDSLPSVAIPNKNIKTYWPLILVLSYILFGVVHLSWLSGTYVWTRMMSDFMGLFFLIFGFFKILDLKGFATSYSSYDLPTKLWPKWAYVYPFIEISLGILYLHQWLPLWTNILTLLVMGLSIVGVIQAVIQKRKIKCVCLGTGFNLPMSTVTIVEDALMILMALFMLWSSLGLI